MRSIRQTIKLIEQQSLVFSLYNDIQKSTRNLAKESGSFIWHQLVKDVLHKMPTDNTTGKHEMLLTCYKYYRGNKKELKNIQLFEQSYTPDDAIRWYTKNCFIYRLINKALRTEDIEVLYTFRYYIVDLSICLCKGYNLLKEFETKTLKLYRGIKQTNEEIERLQKSVGNLISTNGFFSTTRSKIVAEMYAGIGSGDTKYESLLFEIEINTEKQANCICTDVSSYSQFPDEQEVLFDLGTVFEIASIEYNSTDRYWTCKMMSTNRGLEIAEEYLTFRRNEITAGDVDLVILFGNLLYDMGEYTKSELYFKNLLANRGNDANIYLGIGHAQYIKGEYEEAIKNYKYAYDMCDKSDVLIVSKILNFLGFTHKFNGHHHIALDYLSSAFKILEENEPSDKCNRLRADILKMLSSVYCYLENDAKGLECAENALKIIENLASCVHLDLIEALTAAALANRKAGDYDTSLERQKRALKIVQQVLPDNHQYLGVALNNIGKANYKKCNYEKAIEYYERCAAVYSKVWPVYHQRHAIPLNHLGKSYFRLKNYEKALNYYLEALEMLEKTVSLNHTDRAYTIKNIGEVYLDLLDFKKARHYFNQALDIYIEKFGSNTDQHDIAKCYHLIGQ
ncbi:unnamed protein product, partial [Rotaria magnacalcarata]